MSNELTEIQFSLSTAEDEENYFATPLQHRRDRVAAAELPAGTYRVVLGQLLRIVPGVAPALLRDEERGE